MKTFVPNRIWFGALSLLVMGGAVQAELKPALLESAAITKVNPELGEAVRIQEAILAVLRRLKERGDKLTSEGARIEKAEGFQIAADEYRANGFYLVRPFEVVATSDERQKDRTGDLLLHIDSGASFDSRNLSLEAEDRYVFDDFNGKLIGRRQVMRVRQYAFVDKPLVDPKTGRGLIQTNVAEFALTKSFDISLFYKRIQDREQDYDQLSRVSLVRRSVDPEERRSGESRDVFLGFDIKPDPDLRIEPLSSSKPNSVPRSSDKPTP